MRIVNQMEDLSSQVEDLVFRGLQRNLLIHEITEEKKENVKETVIQFLINSAKVPKKSIAIDIAHRIGKFVPGKNRPIVVLFTTREGVEIVKSHAPHLKGTAYKITPHLPREMRARRIAQIPKMIELREQHPESKVTLVNDKLMHDGKLVENNFKMNAIKTRPGNSVVLCNKKDISHSETIEEKKSVFQGHGASVKSLAEVQASLQALHQDGRVADSTHIIYAYKIRDQESNMSIVGHSDDGEWGAAAPLASMLGPHEGYFVAVTRKYGGIDIGNRRFAIINELGKEMLKTLIDSGK